MKSISGGRVKGRKMVGRGEDGRRGEGEEKRRERRW